ncbi:MAG: ribbon-helix-helix protein, CopG family [Deltaproteobacteria bacterium]|nr:ribbon-helix-helix protein, CopG family [Deltaproteobacteria bacterium]
MRTTKLVTISLLPELLDEAEKLAKEEKRSRSEFFREAIRRYIEEKKWERLYRYGRLKAQEQGLTDKDVERVLDEFRRQGQSPSGH